MESALSDSEKKVKSVKEIIDLIEALPITVEEKYQTMVKLMNTVKADKELSNVDKATAVSLISTALIQLHEETESAYKGAKAATYDDTDLDYYGDITIDSKKTYNAKPVMVDPDEINYFTALQIINMYLTLGMPCLVVYKEGYGIYTCILTLGMPCLVVYKEGYGIYTCINGISYEMLMYVSNDAGVDRAWFTDGNGMAIIK